MTEHSAAPTHEQNDNAMSAPGFVQEIRQLLEQRDLLQQKLFESHYETFFMLAFAIDQREGRFGLDVLATGLIARHIAEELQLPPAMVRIIGLAAPLHDIGKIALSDEILLKDGEWSEEEWLSYREHPVIGANLLAPFSINPVMATAEKIARHHHENYNGSGYPDHLIGDAIPLEARIVAVVDGYLSHASYRNGNRHLIDGAPLQVAIDDISDKSGLRYDPQVVQAFRNRVDHIAREYALLLEEKGSLMQQLQRMKASLSIEAADPLSLI